MRDKRLYERILGLPEPWYVEDVELRDQPAEVIVKVARQRGAPLLCPECGEVMNGYDHRRRRWRHLDTCQYHTILVADVPRGECPAHGVRQIEVPWAEARSGFTALFEALVIDWLRETSQLAVARQMGLTWPQVHGIMERAVARGLARRSDEVIPYLGVDEKAFVKRHEYVTTVCDLLGRRVLYVGDGRSKDSLNGFYESLTPKQLRGIEAVAMDMWKAYISATRRHVPGAQDKIVFDKFHIVAHLLKALDQVRRQEHRQLLREGDATLTGTKYLWLMGRDRFDRSDWIDFGHLRDSALRTARAWAINAMFSHLWLYRSQTWARKFFARWYEWAIRSRLQPIKKVARMLKAHLDNILTYLKHRVTNAVTEGINAKIQWLKQTARGYSNRKNFRIAILFHCGGLDLYPHKL